MIFEAAFGGTLPRDTRNEYRYIPAIWVQDDPVRGAILIKPLI